MNIVQTWLKEIAAADKKERAWRERARKVVKAYRDEEDHRDRRFNILWANTETLKPQIYSQTPQPDIRRRYKDNDPVGRQVAEILERSVEYSIDAYDFDGTIDQVNSDHLLPGRGVARIRYIPTFSKNSVRIPIQMDPEKGYMNEGNVVPIEKVMEDENGFYIEETEDEVVYEEVRCDYVHWEDYRQGVARTWAEVPWVAYRHRMTLDELKEAFGDVASEITLDYSPQGEDSGESSDNEQTVKKATIWEIWDKKKREIIFIALGLKDKPVEVREDPFELTNFFAQPEPLYSIKTTDSMVPIPEYTLYQDQARELNRITQRIDRLVEALKARGLYAGEHKDEFTRLMSGDDNELIPVADWAAIQDGKLEDKIAWMPLEQIMKTVQALYVQRSQLLETIYEVTGISDIMRGSTDPRETRGAQALKSQFGVARMQPRQKRMEKFIRDLIEIKVEIMCEMFDPQTFQLMTGIQITPEITQLLDNEGLRAFRIDVETDSTIRSDDQADKSAIVELFQAMATFSQESIPAVQAGLLTPQAAKELMKFALRRYKVARSVEEAFDMPQQPQGPDPVQMAQAQAQMIAEQNKQAELTLKAQDQSMKARIDILKLQQQAKEAEDENERHAIDAAIELAKTQEETYRQAFSTIGAQNAVYTGS